MRLRPLYLALCILGAVLPCSQFLPWLERTGSVPLFFRELFANRVAGAFAVGVIVTVIVVSVFIVVEGRRLRIANLWLPVSLVFAVGISCGLPLFLFRREGALDCAAPHRP